MRFTNTYHEPVFRQMVDKALERVKTILDTTRNPRLPHEAAAAEDGEEEHSYDDKFALAEFLTNTGIAAKMNALERLGLDAEKLQQVARWVHDEQQSVTLRLEASDSCQFLKENVLEIPTGHTREVETTTASSSFLGGTKTETVKTRVTTQVKEYHWKVGLQYRLIVFKGTDVEGTALELQSRTASTILVTSGGQQTSGSVARGSGARPTPPLEENTVHPAIDVNLTWFFQRISAKEMECQFSIDRTTTSTNNNGNGGGGGGACKTPRRNPDVDGAVEFDKALFEWTRQVHNFFVDRVEHRIMDQHKPVAPKGTGGGGAAGIEIGSVVAIAGLNKEPTFNGKLVRVSDYNPDQNRYKVEPVDPKAGLPGTLLIKPQNLKPAPGSNGSTSSKGPTLEGITDEAIFGPVLPLMEKGNILSMGDVADFLNEQNRSLDEAIDNLTRSYPPRTLMKLVSVAEAIVVLLCLHLQLLTQQCTQGVDYIEDMLKQQLVQAIGKEVTSKDFDQFMRFHNQKFFGEMYAPRPFTYAIRRGPTHYPDGALSIEATTEKRDPIETWVRHIPAAGGDDDDTTTTTSAPMLVPIGAATNLELYGDRYLHGWMQHRFKTRRPTIELVARARQFSSFLLIVGTMMGPNKFDPKDAIILQNKDEVLIPLLTNTLPSAKEFKDAIASLSPEQQHFAKAFRSMQLESSVFGVCVIQIKPQLERLLGLPDGALTKEMQLTQDLLSLFVDYQIPSDLLTFEGDASSAQAEKVTAVKGYVKAVLDVIEGEKKKQLEEEMRKADMREEMQHKTSEEAEPKEMKNALKWLRSANSHAAPSGDTPIEADASESSLMSYSSPKGRKMMAASAMMAMPPQPQALMFKGAAEPPLMMAAESAAPPAPVMAGSAAAAPPPSKAEVMKRVRRVRKQAEAQRMTRKEQPVQLPVDTAEGDVGGDSAPDGEDFTLIPKILDSKVEEFDSDNALRTTIVKAGQNWTRKRQENLLTAVATSGLAETEIETERKKAFDLLDAISRSGTLPINCAELHVMIAVSHCFENDVMGTIIQDNINPITKVEKSALMLASTIYGQAAPNLIAHEADVERLTDSFPAVMGAEPSDGGGEESNQDGTD